MASSSALAAAGILLLLLTTNSITTTAMEVVGGNYGWALPPSNNTHYFNDWASANRFRINDTLYFRYLKDSVMEVTADDYDRCRSAHPIFFSNNGNTTFDLDRPGLFYFISGVSGHCSRGLKMIVKVLEAPQSPPVPVGSPPPSPNSSASRGVSLFFGIFCFAAALCLLFFI